MKWIWYGIYLYLVPLECQNHELFVWTFSFRCWRLAEAKKTLQVGKFLTNAKVMITIITIAILKIIAITAIAKRVTAGHSVWYTLADAVSCRCSNENQEVHFRWMNSENNKTASATPPAKTMIWPENYNYFLSFLWDERGNANCCAVLCCAACNGTFCSRNANWIAYNSFVCYRTSLHSITVFYTFPLVSSVAIRS